MKTTLIDKKPIAAAIGLAIATQVAPVMAEDNALQLEEVTITAQKRVENLQDVPIAVTAFGAEDMQSKGILDTDSLSHFVPNLHIKEVEGGSVTFAIRGLSNNFATNIGFENAVGFYVDGVYQGKNYGTLFELGDVERVEVLRGPQGTLYGRNTIGGAINVISARPTGELGGHVKVGFGDNSLLYTNGSINTDAGGFKARVSFYKRERDGYTDNVKQDFAGLGNDSGDFDRFGDIDRQGFRIALDYDIGDAVTISYDLTQSELEDTPRLWQIMDTNAAVFGAAGAGLYDLYNPGDDEVPEEGSSNLNLIHKTEITQHVASVTWRIDDNLTFKSISSLRELDNEAVIDLDGTDNVFYGVDRETNTDQESQEFQFLGSYESLNFVVGAYWFHEDAVDRRVTQTAANGNFQQNALPDNTNQAVFGQVDWSPIDQLTVSAGVRRTWEYKEMDRYVAYGTPFELASEGDTGIFNTTTFQVDASDMRELSLNNTSIMVSPTWHINDDMNLYYKFSQGFRSGGYDGSATDANWVKEPFESEEVDANEIGFKSRLWDNRIQLNVAAFFNEYSNMQLTEFDGQQTHTLNAAEADVYGLEIESSIVIAEGLIASLNLATLDYEYTEWEYNNPSFGVVGKDVTDIGKINNAPENSYSLAVDYMIPGIDFGTLMLNVTYSYQDSVHAVAITSTGGEPNSETDDRELLDARLSLSEVDVGVGDIEIALWGKNLTDETYIDNVIDFTVYRIGTTAAPRTFGIEGTFNF